MEPSNPPTERKPDLMTDWSQPPPWEVWNTLMATGAPPPPPAQMLDLVKGFMVSQCLYTAMRLQVADKLGDGSMNKHELAAACEAIPERIERLMVTLISLGVFALDPQDSSRYVNNPLSATLRKDHPNSMAAMIGHWIEDCYETWKYLPDAMREEGCMYQTKQVYGGKDLWAFYAENPRNGMQFNAAMTAADGLGAWAMARDGPFGASNRIIDVGGSRGHFLAKILQTFPHLSGAVFDLSTVIQASTRPAWTDGEFSHLASRVELIEGSFFEADALPRAREGDAYLLRFILHDWDDPSSTRILRNLRSAIGDTPNARVLICETLLPDREVAVDPVSMKYLLDLHMCVLLGAKERSQREWDELLAAGGFRRAAVHPTRSMMHIIEAVPL